MFIHTYVYIYAHIYVYICVYMSIKSTHSVVRLFQVFLNALFRALLPIQASFVRALLLGLFSLLDL